MAASTFRGSRAAIESRALLLETSRIEEGRVNFSRLMSSGIEKTITSKKVRMQSDPNSPVLRVTDLQKSTGDTVKVDVDHRLTGIPVVGNEDAEGKEDELTHSQYSVSLDVTRYPVKVGSKMDQQRTPYDLYQRVKRSVIDWSIRYDNEMFLYHAFGARGDYQDIDTILPLENYRDPVGTSFNDLMVNDLSPPTDNRSFFLDDTGLVNCIDATLGFSSGRTPSGMTAASQLSIEAIEKLKVKLERMPLPPQKARFEIKTGKGFKMTTPMYVLVVSPKMWDTMRLGAGYQNYAQLVANALKRCAGWDHPLFQGDMLMVGDILVCKAPYTVRHLAGSTVMVRDDNKDGTPRPATVPAGFDIERGLLIGGQMLAQCFGRTKSGYTWSIKTRRYDYDEKRAVAIGKMCGTKKITLRDRDGFLYDNGCITVFGAVPSDV